MIIELAMVLVLGDDASLHERVRGAVSGLPGLATWVDVAPQGRTEKKLDDYKTLLENNIFSPPKKEVEVKPPPPGQVKSEVKPPAPAPDPIMVTGFYLNEAEKRYEAVIEDKKKKEIRFCKEGDTVEKWTIVSVALDKLVVKEGEKTREFKVGDALVGTAPGSIDEKAMLGEADVDPKKVEEARKRRREHMQQHGKKPMADDEEEDTGKVEKRNKKEK